MKYFAEKTIDSTNEYAKRLIKNNVSLLNEGMVVTADLQENGKGTKGRKWHSSSLGGLYYSLAFVPEIFDFNNIETYHIDIAKVVQDVTASITSLSLNIKYPNDLFLNGKKVGGILMESAMKTSAPPRLNYLIIGIGLNINQNTFPDEINEIATSFFIVSKQEYKKELFIKPLTEKVHKLFKK